jgi:DNA processing protein
MSIAWLVLSSVKGLGPVKIGALIAKYGSAEAAFENLPDYLNSGDESSASKKDLERRAGNQLKQAEIYGAKVLTPDNKDYPDLLREIYGPPPVLFVLGDCEVFRRHTVAVVGTRRCTQYGRSVTSLIVKELVENQVVIASGLAHGIDTLAHTACLDNSGRTVAVLGCGIDRCYPEDNAGLFDRIVKNGAVISEFPMGTGPERYNFPRRNRIISGCSAGVLVVEAPEKSGSLITADFAIQQGREVFAVPGSIFSSYSAGPFSLIKNGAIPVRSASDILENINVTSNPVLKYSGSGVASEMLRMSTELLSPAERDVFNVCSESAARIDNIAEKSQKSIAELFDILLSLELKGLVKQVSGQQYVRV